jgi:hypothetical protein
MGDPDVKRSVYSIYNLMHAALVSKRLTRGLTGRSASRDGSHSV